MSGFNQREYQTVILGALLHDAISRLVGDGGKFYIIVGKNMGEGEECVSGLTGLIAR